MPRLDSFVGRESLGVTQGGRFQQPGATRGIPINDTTADPSLGAAREASAAVARATVQGASAIGDAYQAVAQAGDRLSGLSGELIRAKRAEDMDIAVTNGIKGIREIRDEYKDRRDYDPEAKNWETDYDKRTETLMEQLSGNLSSGDQASFNRRMLEPLLIGREHLVTAGRQAWLDAGKAKGMEEVDTYKGLALKAESPEEMGIYLSNALTGVDTRVEANIYTKQEGERIKQGLRNDLAKHVMEARAFHDPAKLLEDLKDDTYLPWAPQEVRFAAGKAAEGRLEHLEAEKRRMEREARQEARDQLMLVQMDLANQVDLAQRTGRYDSSVLSEITRLAQSAKMPKIAVRAAAELRTAQAAYQVGKDLHDMPLGERGGYLQQVEAWSLERDQAMRSKVLAHAVVENDRQTRAVMKDPAAYFAPAVANDLKRMGVPQDSPEYMQAFNSRMMDRQVSAGVPVDRLRITTEAEGDALRGAIDKASVDQLSGILQGITERYGDANVPRVLKEMKVAPAQAVAAQIQRNGKPQEARFFLEASRRKPDEISVSAQERSSVKSELDLAWRRSELGRFLDEGMVVSPYAQASRGAYRADLRAVLERAALTLVEGGKAPAVAVESVVERLQGSLGQFQARKGMVVSAPLGDDMDLIRRGLEGARSGLGVALAPLAEPTDPTWGTRRDGTKKGPGWLGVLRRPDGDVSTELSVTVNLNDKEIDVPLLVPTLNRQEINSLLSGAKAPSKEIVTKAVNHARSRIAAGKSPYITDEEVAQRSMLVREMQRDLADTDRTIWVDHGVGGYALLDTVTGRIIRDAGGNPIMLDVEASKKLGFEAKFSPRQDVQDNSVRDAINATMARQRR